MKPYCKMLPRY